MLGYKYKDLHEEDKYHETQESFLLPRKKGHRAQSDSEGIKMNTSCTEVLEA